MDGSTAAGPRPVALLLPGQGAQHVRMAADLYDRDETFATTMDVCLGCFADGPALRADWLSPHPRLPIDDARRAQPLLLSIDYALGELVRSWGVEPVALLGHSVGEAAAAVLAGVLSFADAATLTDRRVRRPAPAGGMLAVAGSVAQVQPALVPGVVVGAVNAPRQTVLAGPEGPLRTVESRLSSLGLLARRVPSLVGFHSPSVSALADPRDLRGMRLRAPRVALWSGYTAAALTPKEAVDPAFWASHPVAPVLFWAALDSLLATGPLVLLEAGPGQGLVSIARRHRAVAGGRSAALGLLPGRAGDALQAAADFLAAEGYAMGAYV